jgi:hypothetical protein
VVSTCRARRRAWQSRVADRPSCACGAWFGDQFLGRERRFLLFQYRAAELAATGFKDGIEIRRIAAGRQPRSHRLAPVPVRLPLPAEHQGSIYENQRASGRRHFTTADRVVAAE